VARTSAPAPLYHIRARKLLKLLREMACIRGIAMTNYRVVLKDSLGKMLCILCQHEANDVAVQHLQEHAEQLKTYAFTGKLEIEH
jgi:hypothetical protein